MRVPLADGLLLFFFLFVKLSVIGPLLLEFLKQDLPLLLILLLDLFFDVFLVFVLLQFRPDDSLAEGNDWV